MYRAACLGCGWAGPDRPGNENLAVEDAHDHVWPDWRRLPIVKRFHHDANNKALERWLADTATTYALLGFDESYFPVNGGPIRTARRRGGTRSHWSRGFYDICGEVHAERVVEVPAQLSLFD